jgi:hypothetical protein
MAVIYYIRNFPIKFTVCTVMGNWKEQNHTYSRFPLLRILNTTRKYMHAETLADKTIVFSEREVFKVVVMVTQ